MTAARLGGPRNGSHRASPRGLKSMHAPVLATAPMCVCVCMNGEPRWAVHDLVLELVEASSLAHLLLHDLVLELVEASSLAHLLLHDLVLELVEDFRRQRDALGQLRAARLLRLPPPEGARRVL